MRIVPGREGKPVPTHVRDWDGKPIIVRADEVASYFTEEFWAYLEIAHTSSVLETPPFGGGWAEWPADIALALAALYDEDARIAKEKMDGR